jgi:hypothetical protein
MRNLFLKTISKSNDISNDFYKKFLRVKMNEWTMKNILFVVFIIFIQLDVYCISISKKWTLKCVNILHKKKEKTNIKNYRSLFIINLIYKFFTRFIMRRIINSLNRCIERHQSKFMFMRLIFDNIKKTQILVNKANQLKISLYVTLLN